MCGIIGAMRLRGAARVERDLLERAGRMIAHRGPDGAGLCLLSGGDVGLASVRLSIVDPDGGAQPLFNETGSIAAVVNGELYGYAEQRAELERAGHRFASRSDSELVVHLYEELGDEFITRLNGEFALILWDARRRRLLAARDPLGIKPLVFTKRATSTGEQLWLCSEAKGLLALPGVQRELSPRYLAGALFGAFHDHGTAFAGIENVPPGALLVAEEGASPRRVRPRAPARRFDDVSEHMIAPTVDRAVARRLRADCRVGAFLSGGLDSAIVVDAAVRAGGPLECFTVSFPGSSLDEADEARAFARSRGCPLRVLSCTTEALARGLSDTLWATEAAIANPHSVARRLLAASARAHGVKVVLTGEGSDELFAGYAWFVLEALWRRALAGGETGESEALARFATLEDAGAGVLWDDSLPWREGPHPLGWPSFMLMRAARSDAIARKLFTRAVLPAAAATPYERLLARGREELAVSLSPLDASRRMALWQLTGYVLPNLGDRVEMACGLEGRPPLLDPELAELALRLPPSSLLDLTRLRGKAPLYRAFAGRLPSATLAGRKRPFWAPSWRALTEADPRLDEYLRAETLTRGGVFSTEFVRGAYGLWRGARAGSRLGRKLDRLFGIVLCVSILRERLLERRPSPRSSVSFSERHPPTRAGDPLV